MTITSVIYLIALAAAAVLTFRNPRNLLLCYFFFVPWFGLQSDVGLTINIDRLLAVGLLAFLAFHRRRALPVALVVFFLYAVLDSAVMSQFLPDTAIMFGSARGTYRWVGQVAMWGLYLTPLAYIYSSWRPGLARQASTTIIASISILCLIGLIQFLVYRFAGVDILPIGIMTADGNTRTGMLSFANGNPLLGEKSIRISSLGGEPKDLAYSIIMGFDILIVDFCLGGLLTITRNMKIAVAMLFAVVLVLTFSTQGLLLLAFDIVVVVLALKILPSGFRKRPIAQLTAILIAVVCAAWLIPGVANILQARTVQRLSQQGAMEDWNQAVLDWLLANPIYSVFGAGLGNVHLYAANYIPTEFLYYMQGHVFVAKSGGLRILSELGLVGVALFALLLLGPLWGLVRTRSLPGDPVAKSCVLLLALAATNFAASADGPFYVFICAGLVYGAFRRRSRRDAPSGLSFASSHNSTAPKCCNELD